MSSVLEAVAWLKLMVVPQGVRARLEPDTRLALEGSDMAACTLAREERQLLESALGEAGSAIIASIQIFAFDQALSELKNATEEMADAGSSS